MILDVIYVLDVILNLACSLRIVYCITKACNSQLAFFFKGIYEHSWTVATAKAFTPGKERLSECCHMTLGHAACLFHYLTFLFLLCMSWEPQLQCFLHSALSQTDSHGAGGCSVQALASATISQILVLLLIAPMDPQRHNQCRNFFLTGKRSSSLLMVHGLSPASDPNFFSAKEYSIKSK